MPIIVFTPETMKYMCVGAFLCTGMIISTLGINSLIRSLSNDSRTNAGKLQAF